MAGSGDWPIKTVPLTKLRLDPENVRVRADITDEDEILSYLFVNEDVLDLLRDISRDGYFDNEQPMVTAQGDRLIVLEGNRRVSSLKALADPDRVPAYAPRIRAAAARAEDPNFPQRIRVMVAPDRSSALQVIARLHTRNPKKRWIREQQAAFYYNRIRAGQTLEDLRREFSAEPNIRDFIVVGQMMERLRLSVATNPDALDFIDSDKFKITTFEYLYDSMPFRSAIGLAVTDGIVTITGRTPQFLRRLFGQIIIDMQENRINTRKIRVGTTAHSSYIESLVAIANGEKNSHDDLAPGHEEEQAADGGGDEASAEDDDLADDLDGDGDTDGPYGNGDDDNDNDGDDDDPDGDHDPDPDPDNDGDGDGDAAGAGTGRAWKKQRHDQHLDLGGIRFELTGIGMRIRWDELRTINVRNLPNATFDVIRTFIECAIKEYFVEADDPVLHPQGASSPVQLRQCLDHLHSRLGADATVRNGILRLKSKQLSNPADYYSSTAALNDSNHEPDAVFNYEQVNQMWAQVKPLLKLLLAGPPTGDHAP